MRLLDAPPEQATSQYKTVVGVVADAKNQSFGDDPRQEVYVPLRQQVASGGGLRPSVSCALLIRTSDDPSDLINAVRRKIWEVDRNIPITGVRTAEQIVALAVAQPRFNALLLSLFASIALCLGAVGVYGVISYAVTRRTHEIGVRMALGATRANIFGLALGQSLKLALTGLALGIAAALALTRLMTGFLYGVTATDPLTFLAVGLILIFTGLLAGYFPARRAAGVDPMVALRSE